MNTLNQEDLSKVITSFSNTVSKLENKLDFIKRYMEEKLFYMPENELCRIHFNYLLSVITEENK